MVEQVTDVIELDVLALATIIVEKLWYRTYSTADKFQYNNFQPQGYVTTTYKKSNKLNILDLLRS